MAADPRDSDDQDVLRAEIDRLRSLVGPTEASYRDLQDELEAASAATKEATLWAGTYRGRAVQLAAQVQRYNTIEQRVRQAVRPSYRALRTVKRRLRP